MAYKLVNLVALSTLAVFTCSFSSTPVAALSLDSSHLYARDSHHAALFHKKRQNSRRCKVRPPPTSDAKPAVTTTAPAAVAPTTKAPANAPATTKAATTKAATTTKQNTPAPSQAPSPPPSNGGRGKVGLAWPNGNRPTDLARFVTNKVGGIYSWSAWKPEGSNQQGLDFFPMLWGQEQDKIDTFRRLVVPGYGSTILGFNEPDLGSQANMSPERAATVWKQVIQPYKARGFKLVSPAIASAPSSKGWIENFYKACTGCTFDGQALHWYGTNAQAFIDYITAFHNQFNLPVYVTEFACQSFTSAPQCSPTQITNFMNTVTAFMDSTPWVAFYSAFGMMPNMNDVNPGNALMTSGYQRTPLGQNYLT